MPADPVPIYNFHESISAFLLKCRLTLEKDPVILQYGMRPSPWAELKHNARIYQISMPIHPGIYGSWREWFRDYLEDQVGLLAEEINLEVVVKTEKGQLVPIKRKELEDDGF